MAFLFIVDNDHRIAVDHFDDLTGKSRFLREPRCRCNKEDGAGSQGAAVPIEGVHMDTFYTTKARKVKSKSPVRDEPRSSFRPNTDVQNGCRRPRTSGLSTLHIAFFCVFLLSPKYLYVLTIRTISR